MKWIKTDDALPDRVPNRSYSQVPCLVRKNGEIMILVYNHEHECWDDEDGDDYNCDTMQVSHWIALSSLPEPGDESPSSDPADVLVKALKMIRDESGNYRNYQAGSIAAYALAEYEQLKQQG